MKKILFILSFIFSLWISYSYNFAYIEAIPWSIFESWEEITLEIKTDNPNCSIINEGMIYWYQMDPYEPNPLYEIDTYWQRVISFEAPDVDETTKFAYESSAQVRCCESVSVCEDFYENLHKTITIVPYTPVVSSWSRSYWSRMRNEAEYIFSNDINMILERDYDIQSPLMQIEWNYLWGDWAIIYELQLWSNEDLENAEIYNLYSNKKTFHMKELSKIWSKLYFRVRATYNEKKSNRSNIYKYSDETDPLFDFEITCDDCKQKVSFEDILDIESIINRELKNVCKLTSNIDIKFNDIFNMENIINRNISCDTWNCWKNIVGFDELLE